MKRKNQNNTLRLIFYIFTIFIFSSINSLSKEIKPCAWDNREGKPCLKITKSVPNTSRFSKIGLKSYIIDSKEIKEFSSQ